MKFLAHVYSAMHHCGFSLAWGVSGLLLAGCVGLDKPAAVQACASSPQGCSDNPVPANRDAAIFNDARPNSDLPPGNDTPVVQADLPPASPDLRANADLAADLHAEVTGLADTSDGSVGADLKDATEVGLGEVSSSDLASPDWPSSDLPGHDSSGPDSLGPDLPADLPAGRDSPSDIIPDLASDQVKNDTGTGNCITQIIASGYSAGTAPPCSACNDGNGNSLATKCTGMLGCLAPPKTSADFTNCLNAVGGSSRVGDCVKVLTNAGCPGGY